MQHPLASFIAPVTVVVEYDCQGGRQRKPFTDAYKARAWYTAKAKEGKNPRIVKPS